jgi:glycyl-radical enzyme activating protein
MKGIIYDIQRFSLHDGPGIRTTVFLKGCPLRCAWCCNPESTHPEPQLSYDETKCLQCGKCAEVCPKDALRLVSGRLKVDHELCDACEKCLIVCPSGAMKILGSSMDSEEVMEIILRDSRYYSASGGGMTLSGGEPLFQFEFTAELLQKAKDRQVNTCLETSGFASREQFEKLLPLVDQFYFDYKLSVENQHKKYTERSNTLILENLEFLIKKKAFVVLRCILIPGLNTSSGHLMRIAELSRRGEGIQEVQIMPYHNYGIGKYNQIGRQQPEILSPTLSPEDTQSLLEQIRKLGGINIIQG